MNETTSRWNGTWTALVTPFDEAGKVDTAALARLVNWQIDEGITGLVPCGTTGEAATLSAEEQRLVIETVVEAAAGRVPVMAGCGSNDTARTLAAGRQARDAGAAVLLVVSPYYNKPNRSGMLAHYRAICEEIGLPVVVYNVPGRTGQDLGADLILELAGIPGIEAVKEASADLEQIATILTHRPATLAVLSGDDSLVVPTMALGGDGVISVASNEVPGPMSRMVAACREGDFAAARQLHYRLLPLFRTNFIESNPVPVKLAVSLLGRCAPSVRAPLGPATAETEKALREALRLAGVELKSGTLP